MSLCLFSNFRKVLKGLLRLFIDQCDNKISGSALVLFVTLSFISEDGSVRHARLDNDCLDTILTLIPDSVPIEGKSLSLVYN